MFFLAMLINNICRASSDKLCWSRAYNSIQKMQLPSGAHAEGVFLQRQAFSMDNSVGV